MQHSLATHINPYEKIAETNILPNITQHLIIEIGNELIVHRLELLQAIHNLTSEEYANVLRDRFLATCTDTAIFILGSPYSA